MSALGKRSVSRALGVAAAMAMAIITLAVAASPGCFSPSIKDGGFLCAAPPAKACPDGFTCRAGVCLRGSDGGSVDATCTSGPVQPICDDQPGSGQQCNPACQTNCACGRCNVVDGVAVCTPAGMKGLGAKCDLASDDCAAGLICLEEGCGNQLGRCYRHCSKPEHCGAGIMCQIPILDGAGRDTGYLACDLAGQACDPLTSLGCPDPQLNCYLASAGQTLCDCSTASAGTGNLGDPCTLYSDCKVGFACVNASGAARCTAVCQLASPVCPTGRTCVASGTTYGTCNN